MERGEIIKHFGDITKLNGADKTYCVYMYRFPNGKVYIGVTGNSLETRRDNGYQHNVALKKALREYGWRQVEKLILHDGLAEETAFALERSEISARSATDPRYGYNISSGGKSTFQGLKHTDEYRRRMSDEDDTDYIREYGYLEEE